MRNWREILGASPALEHAPPVPPHPPEPLTGLSIGGNGGIGGRKSGPEEPSAAHEAPDLDAFAERAAIREYDGEQDRAAAERAAAAEQGYSDPADLYAAVANGWRRSLETLAAKLSPGCAADAQGSECIAAALRFVTGGWAEKAAALGWSELELFGAAPHSPWERSDQMGAAYRGAAVEHVTASEIEYSASQKFQRGQQAEGAALPWAEDR